MVLRQCFEILRENQGQGTSKVKDVSAYQDKSVNSQLSIQKY